MPAKAAAKQPPAKKTPAKKVPVKATPLKPAPKKAPEKKPVAKPAAKVTKAVAKPTTKAAVGKKAAPPTRKVVPVPKAPAKAKAVKTVKATPPKPVGKAAVAPVPRPVAKSAVARPTPPVPVAPAAPVVVEATRPLGKRAAKKVMLEQMTQAAVVPTHAPDAAKATFSQMNERAVMTPPVPSTIQKDPKRANNWKTLPVEQWTDQDVLAMPDSEYMNDLQLAFFRRKLQQLKSDMLANAGETTEHLREDTVVVPDPADRATIEEEHALELRTRDRERKLLKKIEQAIARIDSGDYGYCEETGEPIGVGRLMARPTASLSLEAQQRRELKQKMFGD
nr:RNA polymerase-binding protein DksA [Hydrogenophaga sp.]